MTRTIHALTRRRQRRGHSDESREPHEHGHDFNAGHDKVVRDMAEKNGCSASIWDGDAGGPEPQEEEVVHDSAEVPLIDEESDCWFYLLEEFFLKNH